MSWVARGGLSCFSLDRSFCRACGLVNHHLVFGGLVMIFENGLLLASRPYFVDLSPLPAVPFWIYSLFFGTLCININDSVIFPNISLSVFVNIILTFHCFFTFFFS